jgi:predicted nucleic acid-binding protein
MKQGFLDTNILARFLIGDVEDKQKEVRNIFERGIKLEYEYTVLTEVFVELHYVLISQYGLSRQDFVDGYIMITKLPFIKVDQIYSSLDFLEIYQNYNISLEDSLYLSYCLANDLELISFDKKLINVWNRLRQ